MHVLVYENPRAGGASRTRVDAAVSLLRDAGWRVERELPQDANALGEAGRRPPDVDAVILAGGDGTLSTYLQSFPASGPPIGLLPVGTANVVARDLGLPLDPVAAASALLDATPVPVDMGLVTGANRSPRRFILSASAGDIGAAVEAVSAPLKRILGGGAYGVSFAASVWRWRSLTVIVDGARVLAGSVIVTATRHYAGGFVLDSSSRPGDGWLDVYIVPPGPAAAAAFAQAAARHRLRAHRAREIQIETDSALECDGDPAGRAPCTIAIDRQVHLLGPAIRS